MRAALMWKLNYSAERMADEYEALYGRVISRTHAASSS